MTKGITGSEPDPRVVYADIIDLPPWQSPVRPRMSLSDRAAQFAPFAALTGFDDMITEEARPVDRKAELSEEETDRLNQQLLLIADELAEGRHPVRTVTFFIPDARKAGGRYETVTARVRRLNPVPGRLVLSDPDDPRAPLLTVDIADILTLESE